MSSMSIFCLIEAMRNHLFGIQVLGDEPEYSSCHGRVIATLDYMWYSETPHQPSASGDQIMGSPVDKAMGQSVSDASQHGSNSASAPATIQNGDSLSPRGACCLPLLIPRLVEQPHSGKPWFSTAHPNDGLQGAALHSKTSLDNSAWNTKGLLLSVSLEYADMQHSNHRQRARQQAIACELPDISEDAELPTSPGLNALTLLILRLLSAFNSSHSS